MENEYREGAEALKRREKILEKSAKMNAYMAKREKEEALSCQFCGCTTLEHLGVVKKIPSRHSLSQHESWCVENPYNRRTREKHLEKISAECIVICPKLKGIVEVSKRLNLSSDQILKLIEFQMDDTDDCGIKH